MLHLSLPLKHELDLLGAAFDFLSVILFLFINPWAWFFSIVAMLVNTVLYWGTGLFADTWLQGVYFISSLYGWYYWLHGGKKHYEAEVHAIRRRHALVLVVLGVLSFLVLAYVLGHWHSKVPVWDASTTVLSLIGQWLTCRKLLESWVVWFTVDVMYVMLYSMKGIPMHSVVYSVYLVLAVLGYLRWRQQVR